MTHSTLKLAALASVVGIAACGGSSTSKFVGTWSTDLSIVSQCIGDGGSGTNEVQDALTITLGTTTDLKSIDFEGCALTYSVSGNTATATSQTCNESTTTPAGDTVTTALVYKTYALTTSDGKSMTITGTLAATTTSADGSQLTCEDTVTGTATKESAVDGG